MTQGYTMGDVAAVLIFMLTYLAISTSRLRLLPIGRPTAALAGAVLMVEAGILTHGRHTPRSTATPSSSCLA